MIRTILNGARGRMGRTVAELIEDHPDLTVVAGVDLTGAEASSFPIYPRLSAVSEAGDVVIDFSSPDAAVAMVGDAAEKGLAVVIATTGLTEDQRTRIDAEASRIPILRAANMSLGINLLRMLVRQTAAALGAEFDIEIVEKHHKMKKDAPSGTALALAGEADLQGDGRFVYGREGRRALRESGEIGIHAVRGGTIVGEHDVIFAGPDEVITLRHTAYSRSLFAAGAIQAARFLAGRKPGLYSMDDVLSSR